MRVQYDPDFSDKLKRVNVRIRKSFNEQIELFKQNPHNSQLHNHALKEPYEGLRSIDITNDYCAVYEEVPSGSEIVAYFSLLGTHDELYG